MELVALNGEIIALLVILLFAMVMFVFELVRVDVAALTVLVILGLSSLIPGYDGLVPARFLFDGFASNAVISIIAVMIIGAGLDKTGFMGTVASRILRWSGTTEARIVATTSSSAAVISSFMQNIGAAALYLPVVNRISRRTGIPLGRMLMPMGFCAILGGTTTMIGSSPLILLNDLLISANRSLPVAVDTMDTYGLFAVMPVGIVLVTMGVLYFVYLGKWVLPAGQTRGANFDNMQYFKNVYGIHARTFEVVVQAGSDMCGKRLGEIRSHGRAGWILGVSSVGTPQIAPSQDTEILANSVLAIMGSEKSIREYAEAHQLHVKNHLDVFADILSVTNAGIAEVVIPPDSALIGKTVSELQFRRSYRARILAVYRIDVVIDTDMPNVVLQSGDTLVLHAGWEDMIPMANSKDFAVVTDFPHETYRPNKLLFASLAFFVAIGLVIFSALSTPLALMTGAILMVLTGVIKIEEAYLAVSWQTVFLLASLIPLGMAMQNTGAAQWLAGEALAIMEGTPVWGIQAMVAVLATALTLVMSNVGATVLLVPLAIQLAIGVGADPAMFALTVALCTSNSFLIPTHQVNALIMGPGGYRVMDFLRAGGGMTLIFLTVVIVMLNLFY